MMSVDEVLSAIPSGEYSWTMSLIQYELGKYEVQKNIPHATDLCAAFTALYELATNRDLDYMRMNRSMGETAERQRILGIIDDLDKILEAQHNSPGVVYYLWMSEKTLRELRRRIEAKHE